MLDNIKATPLSDVGIPVKQVITVSLEDQGFSRKKIDLPKKQNGKKRVFYSRDAVDQWLKVRHPQKFNGAVIVKKPGVEAQVKIRYASYEEYLESDLWKSKRRHIRFIRGGVCEGCGTEDNLHVHHGSYAHVGNEPDNELFLVCRSCHAGIHGRYTAPKKKPNKALMKRTLSYLERKRKACNIR